MHRLAIFAEGYTEVCFLERLIEEIFGQGNYSLEVQSMRGGSQVPKTVKTIKLENSTTNQQYFVLLVDCGGDKQVKTRIMEEHAGLTRSGYSKIIGMRDVRPDFSLSDVSSLEAGLKKYIKTSLIPVEFILCIMEIEAWFIAEFNHFPKIDKAITCTGIQQQLGFNPEVDDISVRPYPSKDLNDCYAIAGRQYSKGSTTIGSLDYEYIYFELIGKIPYLKKLISEIESALP